MSMLLRSLWAFSQCPLWYSYLRHLFLIPFRGLWWISGQVVHGEKEKRARLGPPFQEFGHLVLTLGMLSHLGRPVNPLQARILFRKPHHLDPAHLSL